MAPPMTRDGARGPRVVFVVPDYPPATGGTASQTRLQAVQLIQRGWAVDVLTRRNSRSWPRREVMEGVNVLRVGPPSDNPARHLAALAGVGAALGLVYRRATVVQVVMDADSAVVSCLAGHAPRTSLMWATLGDARKVVSGPFGPLRRRGLHRAAHVVLTAEMEEELRDLGLPTAAVIPVPVDTARFAPASAELRRARRRELGLGDGPVIVFTGHLERRKAVDRLLEAFALLLGEGRDTQLLLVGGDGRVDGLGGQLRSEVQSRGLSERVTFTGPVSDVLPYLQGSDIFCLPSWREGMPNSLLEAMACGLACVAPRSAGGDVLSEGAGVIPPSNTPEDLAGALASLIDDGEGRARVSGLALERVAQLNAPGAVIDAYERKWASMRLLPERVGPQPVGGTG